MTVSPQLRLLALIALIAVVGGAGALLLMGRSGSGSAAPKVIKPLHPVAKHASKPAAHKAAAAKQAVAKHPAKPAAHKAAPPKKAPKPKAPVVTAKGLPASLVTALTAHPVVVVALYQVERTSTASERLAARKGSSPDAAVGIDRLALAEAQAGAHDAHAGFLGVDVFRRTDAEPLAKLLGVLQDPAVLVFKRPGTVFVQLSGYADRDTIAQAATNAALQQ